MSRRRSPRSIDTPILDLLRDQENHPKLRDLFDFDPILDPGAEARCGFDETGICFVHGRRCT